MSDIVKNKADTQSRKYLLTINNPLDSDRSFTHDRIKEILKEWKPLAYYCMADERGLDTKTLHSHVFLKFKTPVRFSTVSARFENKIHIDSCNGSLAQIREYVKKEGKWRNDPKSDTAIDGTFEESGDLEIEDKRKDDMSLLVQLIRDEELTDAEIINTFPPLAKHIDKMERLRQTFRQDIARTTIRHLEVNYIYGETGVGKTRYVMERYGYENVYKVTDYNLHPWDSYQSQRVILLDEYRSSFPVISLLNMLDIYPLPLSARYTNRWANYTVVYIVSNIQWSEQYPDFQINELATWRALCRRIHHVYRMESGGRLIEVFPSFIDIDTGKPAEFPQPDNQPPQEQQQEVIPF